MPGFPVLVNPDAAACASAALACDDLAQKLEDQLARVRSLRNDVLGAWQGDGGASLDSAVAVQAQALRTAADELCSAARTLRAAAAEKKH
jgi:uncharacterized protein YukE